MSHRKKYLKRADTSVIAVRLDLDTDGFSYRKWGGVQSCKRGDWLVNNQGDIYTIDAESFARTYREVTPGVYKKHTEVWAERALSQGVVTTKEGQTRYQVGDYLVYNDEVGEDAYAVAKDIFESQYVDEP